MKLWNWRQLLKPFGVRVCAIRISGNQTWHPARVGYRIIRSETEKSSPLGPVGMTRQYVLLDTNSDFYSSSEEFDLKSDGSIRCVPRAKWVEI
jgi:hypothetical protein